MKTAIIDNYDSFTYNLVSTLETLGHPRPAVLRNDRFRIEELEPYTHLILSPGPGLPDEAGLLKEVIRAYSTRKEILGICLGMQAIAEVFGGKLRNLETVHHGISTPIHRTESSSPLFREIPGTFPAGRYHSWVVDRKDLPACLQITCEDDQGEIMGVRHREFPVYGLQFHPESIMTEVGPQLLENFVGIAKRPGVSTPQPVSHSSQSHS